MNKRIVGIGGLVLAAVLLVAVNIVSGELLRASRIDLTESGLFTLSRGTHEVLESIEEPITLRLYLSRGIATRLPGIKSYVGRVEELLEAYAREAGDRITLLTIEPEPFSEEEDRAVGYGLRGVPIDEEGNTLYFGLVATGSTGQEEVIPFFSTGRERFLEYDVTRLIYTVANPKQPVVGLISPLPILGAGPRAMLQGLSQPPWVVGEQMQELFDVRRLDLDLHAVPDEIDVLMLAHPKSLPEHTLYAIDQFVMRGGRVLAFVDPNAEVDPGASNQSMMGMRMQASKTSNPERLLASWGLAMPSDEVVGDLSVASRVRTQDNGRAVTIDYPLWLNLSGDMVDDSDIVTGSLGNLTLASPGHLDTVEGSGLEVTPLVRTSDQAKLFERQRIADYADAQGLLRDYEPAGKRFVLAARVTGTAASAFPDGAPPPPEKKDGDAPADADPPPGPGPHVARSESPINVIVVADVDLLADRFWVDVQDLLGTRIAVPSAANGPFAINALDNLTGSGALIDVRSQGSFLRPFERVDRLRQQAEQRFREKEQQLSRRLEQLDERMRDLERRKQGGDAMVLSEAQQRELLEFRQERLAIRKELREVRRSLRERIERLEGRVKFANVALVPILIGIGGAIVGLLQLRRRRRSMARA